MKMCLHRVQKMQKLKILSVSGRNKKFCGMFVVTNTKIGMKSKKYQSVNENVFRDGYAFLNFIFI